MDTILPECHAIVDGNLTISFILIEAINDERTENHVQSLEGNPVVPVIKVCHSEATGASSKKSSIRLTATKNLP